MSLEIIIKKIMEEEEGGEGRKIWSLRSTKEW
jgi:hypothetical protein